MKKAFFWTEHHKVKILFFIIFYASLPALARPSIIVNCIDEFKKTRAAEKAYLTDGFKKGLGWDLKYIMATDVRVEGTDNYESQASSGELSAGPDYRIMMSRNVEVYADEHDIFTVFKNKRQVMRTPAPPGAFHLMDNPLSQVMQDSLLKMYRLTDCDLIDGNGKERNLICYHLIANDSRKCEYSKLTVYTDAETHLFRKMNADANPNVIRNIKHCSVEFIERKQIKLDPSMSHLQSKFLDNLGRLKAPYAQYKFLDVKHTAKQRTIHVQKKH